MQKDDLNKYQTSTINHSSGYSEGELARTAGATAKTIGGMVWKTIKTVLIVTMLTGLLVFISVASFILSFNGTTAPDIGNMSLDENSFVMVQNSETGEFEQYMELRSSETNRVWVDFADIPQAMKDAQVAIEDKRFQEHHGVDWYNTGGAVFLLISGDNGRGGSTITQQLVKNMTEENDYSVLRKIKEIFMALNMEKDYSKDDILEAYLNLVNYGGTVMGVQAAANLYFGKNIQDCDIAECASIAGITQYPWLYNPMNDREENKIRQQTVLKQMFEQGYISNTEYAEALEKSENMVFAFDQEDDTSSSIATNEDIYNWYIETMIDELIVDIAEYTGLSSKMAAQSLYTSGYEIYCAMDEGIQEGVEELFQNEDNLPYEWEVDFGVYAMDYDGKTIAVVGGRTQKTSNRVFNNATHAYRQTGSSIKALSIYAAGVDAGYITYGSVMKDSKIEDYYGKGKAGPNNFSRSNEGYMNVDKAVEISQNMPAAQFLKEYGFDTSYNFLVDKLHFSNIVETDKDYSPLALGGFTYGASVQEMTAGFQIFGNGGVYNEPYTYYYVKDNDGNTILSNLQADNPGEQVMTEENAGVMNKLLHRPIYGSQGTAKTVKIDGLDIFGKTGTSDLNYDITFYAGTELCVAGVWNGYKDRRVTLNDTATAKDMWKVLMEYLYTNSSISFSEYYKISDNIVEEYFCRDSGLIAGSNCYNTDKGWYANTDYGIPDTCNGGSDHIHGSKKTDEDSESSSSATATPIPSEAPAASATPDPNGTATPVPSEAPVDTPTPVPPTEAPPTEPPVTEPPVTEPPVTEAPIVVTTPIPDNGTTDEGGGGDG